MDTKRLFFFVLGLTLLGMGIVGVIIPLLPTTPFILAAFLCFGKSSKKAERWILNNRYFGSYIENYKAKNGIPLDIKFKSIAFLWITLIISSIFFFSQLYVLLLLLIIGIIVTTHIFLLKTKNQLF
ncbi:YbaN family protein [Methanobacterium sp. ACI-7]|uniref:YbaN family protein n=1 Tax=unclassified Methanobacterium TaxID=2627676 RepID=UPI0039C20FF3